VRYACDCDGVWQLKHDRSDRTDTYSFAAYDEDATESDLEFAPQNGTLPKCDEWQSVVVK